MSLLPSPDVRGVCPARPASCSSPPADLHREPGGWQPGASRAGVISRTGPMAAPVVSMQIVNRPARRAIMKFSSTATLCPPRACDNRLPANVPVKSVNGCTAPVSGVGGFSWPPAPAEPASAGGWRRAPCRPASSLRSATRRSARSSDVIHVDDEPAVDAEERARDRAGLRARPS